MLTIPYNELARQITITVKFTGAEVWRLRLWLATHLFKFSAWVFGTDKIQMIEIGNDLNS